MIQLWQLRIWLRGRSEVDIQGGRSEDIAAEGEGSAGHRTRAWQDEEDSPKVLGGGHRSRRYDDRSQGPNSIEKL